MNVRNQCQRTQSVDQFERSRQSDEVARINKKLSCCRKSIIRKIYLGVEMPKKHSYIGNSSYDLSHQIGIFDNICGL